MKKFIVAAVVFIAAAASVVNARDDEPSWEAVEQYARNYMQQLKKEGMSERETANQLASSIWWSEKLQLLCPSYFYVNARRARYDYLLRQGTWNMMYGVGKTATSILNQAANRRNEEFNNVVGAAKGTWCESVKAFGIKTSVGLLCLQPVIKGDAGLIAGSAD